ncbi:MAG: tRNA lysidine(34) synthetase TilS [Steroidobacteraceae bacterium]|nr:tRNA lysidine(34) synthetase TilS [Steroidobacteraceae bacterium]
MSGPNQAPERPTARGRDDLPRRLGRRLDSLVPAGERPAWVVAFSGGVDSLALLAALHEWQLRQPVHARQALRAVHVDHGLNPRSGDWARHCRRVCRALGVPLRVRRARLVPPRGASLEAVAREARYRLLGEGLRAGEVLLTAHHLDDQLETLLLQLMRGAGVAGLAAMPARLRLGRGWLLRPLLEVGRAELEAWVSGRDLAWVDDDSNADPRFDRNYLRRTVVPALKARWSAAAQVAARSAAHLADARHVLEEVAASDLAAASRGPALDVAALRALSPPRRRHAVRAWIQGHGLPAPDTRHLARVLGELCDARVDAQAGPVAPAGRASLNWDWRRGRPLSLGPGLGRLVVRLHPDGPLDAARLPVPLAVRWRAGGERLRTEPAGPRRTLKELLRSRGVLPWMRERLPLLHAGSRLVCVADLVADAGLLAGPSSRRRCRIEWLDAPAYRVVDPSPAD